MVQLVRDPAAERKVVVHAMILVQVSDFAWVLLSAHHVEAVSLRFEER